MKTCSKCGQTLPLCEFHKSNGKRRADCKKCYNAGNNAKKNARSNAISRLAYTIVGGSKSFYALPKEERQRVRAQATSLWLDGRTLCPPPRPVRHVPTASSTLSATPSSQALRSAERLTRCHDYAGIRQDALSAPMS